MSTVLVCGGRNYASALTVSDILGALNAKHRFTLLIHGGASGADSLAHGWAEMHDVPVREFPADWATNGRAAGPIRNERMLREGKPDLVVAFPGGKGTAHMVSIARRAGVTVYEVAP